MPDTALSPQPPIEECCHCDEQTFVVCPAPAAYRTFYKGIECAFCEKHYLLWIVRPLLEGTLESSLVSPVPPGSEVGE